MPEQTNFWKDTILEFLDFIRIKIENGDLTLSEWEDIAKTIGSEVGLKGTVDDFARFYGKTKTNVTTVIDRKMLPRPERCLLHSFNEFRKVIPSSWRNHKKVPKP